MAATYPTAPSRSEKQHERRQAIDKVLAATLEVLNSGTATRLPIVQSAFGSAARIVEVSQKVRANQDGFVELAEEGSWLVYYIILILADTKQKIEPDSLEANLKQLLGTLQSIQTFGEKCAARGTIKAVLMFGFDINEINAQRRKLERCMRLFQKTNELLEMHRQNGGVLDNNHRGDAEHRSTNPENTDSRVKTSISPGSGANFAGSTGIAIGAYNQVNVNSNNRTGNGTGSGGGKCVLQ